MAHISSLAVHIANASVVDAPQRRSTSWPLYIIVFALGFAVAHISF